MKKILFLIALVLFASQSCKKEEIKSNEAKFLSFSILGEKGVIDETKKEITITFAPFTEIASLSAVFQVSPLATVSVGTVSQQTAITTNNYTNPVIFTVQAEDGTKVNYKVTATVTKSSEKKLLTFGFRKSVNNSVNVPEDVYGCVKNTNITLYTVATDLNAPNTVSMIPSFTVSNGAKLLIDGVEFESEKTSYKFSSNATSITVKAQDGTEQKYSLSLTSQILNIYEFAQKCPTEDVLFSKFIKDFEIRRNGVVVTKYDCNSKYDDNVRVLQCIRVMYYLDIYKKKPYLPWTNLRFYDWVKDKVQGFDIVDDLGGLAGLCCKEINGKQFISLASSKNDPSNAIKYTYQDGADVLNYTGLFAHERRHADPGNYPHINCNGNSADADYNENNLGGYGVSYWFSKAYMTGILEVGAKCLTTAQRNVFNNRFGDANYFVSSVFCKNSPPVVIPATYKDCDCQ
jgi:hypothetical protein